MANNLKKTFGRQSEYNEKDFIESKINHRIQITNVISLVKLFSPLRDFHLVLSILNQKMFDNPNDVV
jgi:hypothetical protein